jgi:hypothetical protein
MTTMAASAEKKSAETMSMAHFSSRRRSRTVAFLDGGPSQIAMRWQLSRSPPHG